MHFISAIFFATHTLFCNIKVLLCGVLLINLVFALFTNSFLRHIKVLSCRLCFFIIIFSFLIVTLWSNHLCYCLTRFSFNTFIISIFKNWFKWLNSKLLLIIFIYWCRINSVEYSFRSVSYLYTCFLCQLLLLYNFICLFNYPV
jgi:hypothetical protein